MATNEVATDEELGGAQMHSSISGVSDFLAKDEKEALEITKNLITKIKSRQQKISMKRMPLNQNLIKKRF